jgi:hypothetical protein
MFSIKSRLNLGNTCYAHPEAVKGDTSAIGLLLSDQQPAGRTLTVFKYQSKKYL